VGLFYVTLVIMASNSKHKLCIAYYINDLCSTQ
jgi:hypothetical protein